MEHAGALGRNRVFWTVKRTASRSVSFLAIVDVTIDVVHDEFVMNHSDHNIAIYDDQGEQLGQKRRRDISKVVDVVHCAVVIVKRSSGGVVLAQIPETTLYGGLWAATAATMVRVGESAEEAACRCLKKELGIDGIDPVFLGKRFYIFPDGIRRWKSVFIVQMDISLVPNGEDASALKEVSPIELGTMLREDPPVLAPTFIKVWEDWLSK